MALPNELNVHYVKFMRGSVSAWENLLTTPNKISDDTLYFIYESVNNPTEGKLYLGKKLISGNGSSENVNINDIGDIYIDDATLADKQLLVYNETSEQWVNTSLSNIINDGVGVFVGASSTANGIAGLVPRPVIGDQNKFLSGNGSWTTINIPTFDPKVFGTNASGAVTLLDITQAPVGTIPVKNSQGGISWSSVGAGQLSRQVITMSDLEALINNGTANENTIYMVAITNPIDSSDQYNEYLVISGQLELIGTIGNVNLSDYVTNSTFQSTVGNLNSVLYDTTSSGVTSYGLISRVTFLETKVGDLNNLILSGTNTTLVEEVNEISERLQWHELNNE